MGKNIRFPAPAAWALGMAGVPSLALGDQPHRLSFPCWLCSALGCKGSPGPRYPNQPLSRGLLLPCFEHSSQGRARRAFVGLWLLVVGSLEQQEGALSQLISKSSSDTAQPFCPPQSPHKPAPSQVACPPGLVQQGQDEALVQHWAGACTRAQHQLRHS